MPSEIQVMFVVVAANSRLHAVRCAARQLRVQAAQPQQRCALVLVARYAAVSSFAS